MANSLSTKVYRFCLVACDEEIKGAHRMFDNTLIYDLIYNAFVSYSKCGASICQHLNNVLVSLFANLYMFLAV